MRARSLQTVVVGVMIAFVAIVTPASRGSAALAPSCTATAGVTVIVDFTHFHRDIERGCAPGRPATALAAMQSAGFATAGTTRYGDAFLCRIDDLPAPKAEACNDTPPDTAYWSFYRALPTDAAWTYTAVGVLSFRPAPGTIIAFAFGAKAAPGILPAAAIRATQSSAPSATTQPRPAAPTTTTPASTTPVAAAAVTTTPVATTSVATTSTVPASSTTRTTPSSTTTTTTTTTTAKRAAARIVDRNASPSAAARDSGSPVGAILAALIVAALGLAIAFAVRARRRRAA